MVRVWMRLNVFFFFFFFGGGCYLVAFGNVFISFEHITK